MAEDTTRDLDYKGALGSTKRPCPDCLVVVDWRKLSEHRANDCLEARRDPSFAEHHERQMKLMQDIAANIQFDKLAERAGGAR